MDADHRQLHNVGCGALNGHIDGHALGGAASVEVGAVDVGQVAAAAHQRLHILVGAGVGFDLVQVFADAGVLGEVGVYELAALLPGEARLLGNAVGRQPVDDAEVQHLGDPAHLGVNFVNGNLEHQGCGGGMDILASLEGFQQPRVLGQVGQHPQLDLGIVSGEKLPVGRAIGNESAANLSAQLGTNGDVL